MKSYVYAALIFSFLLLTIPAAPIVMGKTNNIKPTEATQTISETTENTSEKKSDFKKYETLKVLDITTGQVEEISAFDYTVGAVCAEMPATFEPEALKAQAIAAYTYAVRQARKAELAPDPELGGAYFSNDSNKYQAYFTENQAMQYYGDNYDEYIKKIKEAVKAVEMQYITYEDEPIIAAFHSVSSGKTESAKNVWGSDIPYLTAVDSKYDSKSPDFFQNLELSESEIKEMLEIAFDGIKLPENPEKWFTEAEISDSETVITIKAGNKTLTGQQLRTALSLRSAAFEIKYNEEFKITVKGCGHGVGMSRYGANEMAKTGKKYDEILKHYYKGIEIIK